MKYKLSSARNGLKIGNGSRKPMRLVCEQRHLDVWIRHRIAIAIATNRADTVGSAETPPGELQIKLQPLRIPPRLHVRPHNQQAVYDGPTGGFLAKPITITHSNISDGTYAEQVESVPNEPVGCRRRAKRRASAAVLEDEPV